MNETFFESSATDSWALEWHNSAGTEFGGYDAVIPNVTVCLITSLICSCLHHCQKVVLSKYILYRARSITVSSSCRRSISLGIVFRLVIGSYRLIRSGPPESTKVMNIFPSAPHWHNPCLVLRQKLRHCGGRPRHHPSQQENSSSSLLYQQKPSRASQARLLPPSCRKWSDRGVYLVELRSGLRTRSL